MNSTLRHTSVVLTADIIEAVDEIRFLTRDESILSLSEIIRSLLTRAIAHLFAVTEHAPDTNDLESAHRKVPGHLHKPY